MKAWLRHDVIAEPLINQWYAWSYLIPPATAARYLTQSHLQVMASFIEAPQVHIAALRNPDMIGGPFIQYGEDRVAEMQALLQRTDREQTALIALSAAITELEQLLATHTPGTALATLYPMIPAPLRGFVELVYDARNNASARYQEGLFYRSEYYRPQNQAVALRRVDDSDSRAFVMSTPRLESDVDVMLRRPFSDDALDALFRSRHTATDVDELALQLQLDTEQSAHFHTLFTTTPPRSPQRFNGEGVRVRYFGHACVLVETAQVSILVDPLISYEHPAGMARFSYEDLPPFIDYVLITHNHQDHVMLESLLQLRHKIGQIVVPRSNSGNLLDPSLRLALKQTGFANVVELDQLDSLVITGGGSDDKITALPFLGEHGDLDIACKAAWRIDIQGRSVLCVADSDNLDDALYEHIAQLFGPVDMLFIGMECEGAPYSWAYGPLLPAPVAHAHAQARRLNGSDAERGQRLLQKLQPAQVYVYAMGQEPWLNYITSIHYTETSLAIVESSRLIADCHARGIVAQRLLGKAELLMPAAIRAGHVQKPLAARQFATSKSAARTMTLPDAAAAQRTPAAENQSQQDELLLALLDELHAASIQLALDNESLRVNAPKGALTAELTARIRQHKPALIALLRNAGAGHATTAAAALPADAQLPADIHPQGTTAGNDVRNILLTGATGFVGAFLLHELLHQTDATIYCLVRNASDNIDRVRAALQDYGLWQEAFTARLRIVNGDLAASGLNLSSTDREWLQHNIDAIYHNGAHVHHLLPYEQLRAANVQGTIEMLRLACSKKIKPLHFISSLSVLPPPALANGMRFGESDPLPVNVIPAGGYNRSKWMAEHLVREAFARGLPGTIHRPGPVSGDSRNGAFNSNDFLYRLMRGYLHLGMAPYGEMPIDLLPVDYLAQAIVYLSRHPDTRGKTFHLLHPQPVSSDVMFDAIVARGHVLQRVPYADWHRELQRIAREEPEHPLYAMVALFASRQNDVSDNSTNASTTLPYEHAQTQSLLAQAPFALPALDVQLFTTYLDAMERQGTLRRAMS